MQHNWGRSKTYQLIVAAGFKFAKQKNYYQRVKERDSIIEQRLKYIDTIRKLRADPAHPNRRIWYQDETWWSANSTLDCTWVDESGEGGFRNIKRGRGQRVMICHLGCAEIGFLPQAELIWHASKSTADYHDNMNATKFLAWLNRQVFPNVSPGDVIVLDQVRKILCWITIIFIFEPRRRITAP